MMDIDSDPRAKIAALSEKMSSLMEQLARHQESSSPNPSEADFSQAKKLRQSSHATALFDNDDMMEGNGYSKVVRDSNGVHSSPTRPRVSAGQDWEPDAISRDSERRASTSPSRNGLASSQQQKQNQNHWNEKMSSPKSPGHKILASGDQVEAPGASIMNSSSFSSSSEVRNVRVVLRVRPPLEHELNGYLGVPYEATTKVSKDRSSLTVSDPGAMDERGISHQFVFDHVYDESSSQREVYETTARPLVASCLKGYNATILAYGQTGTGKTYTMEGDAARFESRGIVPRAIEQIFAHIQEKASNGNRFLVRASYLQIYNDAIYDLLKPERANLPIREDDKNKHNNRGVYVEGLSEYVVRSPMEIFKLMAAGAAGRATGKTKLNEVSSRSHAILRLIVEQCETTYVDPHTGNPATAEQVDALIKLAAAHGEQLGEDGSFRRGVSDTSTGSSTSNGMLSSSPSPRQNRQHSTSNVDFSRFIRKRFRVAKLNLVDLAGSERVRISGATGQRLEESRKINRSLSALGNVISALTTESRAHVPYRDSKLTRILEDSLGGNCRTAFIANVSPAVDAVSETLSTLKFATRAKSIRNFAHVNEDVDRNSLLRKYEKELKRLRRELRERSQNVVDQRVVLELEDQKRRAEEDKMAALRALEARSFQFMEEKQAKRKLEEKICALESQMLVGGDHAHAGGKSIQNTPAFRETLVQVRDQMQLEMRQEYKDKMLELEKELREDVASAEMMAVEEKRKMVRYIELLQRQKAVMEQLVTKMQEKDGQIVSLQDELDELERAHVGTQELLDRKTAELIRSKRIIVELEERSRVSEVSESEPAPADEGGGQAGSVVAQTGLEGRLRALTVNYNALRDQMADRLYQKDSNLKQIMQENAELRQQLIELQAGSKGRIVNTDNESDDDGIAGKSNSFDRDISAGLVDEVEKLRVRSINHAKEQLAMRTIMEKLNLLALNITSTPQSMDPAILQQVQTLSQLTSASVKALNNSFSQD